jgi:hypothetical protein
MQPVDQGSRVVVLVVAAAAVAVLVVSGVSLVGEVLSGHPMTPYVAPQYWLSYRDGFVRRGLPGEVLRLLTSGTYPSLRAAEVLGVGLSVAAVLGVLALAAMLARRAGDRSVALAVAGAVVASPLGLSLFARDLGRTDAVGVLVLVALAAVPWSRLPSAALVVGVAVLSAVAVATEEFLVALVLPVALVAAGSALAGRRYARPWTLLAVLPALLVAVLSAVVPAPAGLLTSTLAAARAAGVPPSVPTVPAPPDHDSVSRLKYGFVENLQAYYATVSADRVVLTALLWAVAYLLLVVVVGHLLGRSLRDRAYGAAVTLFALAAVALSVAGIDYRRWWTLAAVAALCLLLQLGPGPRRPSPLSWPAVLALVVLAAAGVALQNTPVWPLNFS